MNSRGAVEHRNSCNLHAAELRWEMKPLSTSTRTARVGRPAEKELAPFQQASPKLHEETWAGLLTNQSLSFSLERKSFRGVLLWWLGLHCFSEEKYQFSLDVKQKHTFYQRKSTKKSLRSADLTLFILSE